MNSIGKESNFFQNKPSIIDLYIEEEINLENVVNNLKNSDVFKEINILSVKDSLIKVDVNYQDNNYIIYLKEMVNDYEDLDKINHVLIDSKTIDSAKKQKKYLKSYINADDNFVQSYYAQIKLLACVSNQPILIVDCTQWCLYSGLYLKQFMYNHVDIIDSNLFKIKATNDGTLYSEGLERFGVKEIEMVGIDEKYQKAAASFLSRLARYFIENGQTSNTCQNYGEVYENTFYVCLIDIEIAMPYLNKRKYFNPKTRSTFLNTNRVYVSIHGSNDVDDWYTNDQDVLDNLLDHTSYYTSQVHFDDERKLAHLTIDKAINFLSEIDDLNNLMILAKREDITTDWYYLDKKEGSNYYLKNNKSDLIISLDNILNWNYFGITPLYAFALEKSE